MLYRPNVIVGEVESYLESSENKGMLRFITCGSVDDGKSTLIGRLLYESKVVFEDQLSALEADSRRFGTQGDQIDLALLVDGLSAEREQGITIDVAYRYFSTEKRKFIVADTPGHEQYTRNMVTAASATDLAVVIVDARKGILQQTRRHSYLVSLLGIRQIVVVVNKMDLVGYSKIAYEEIAEDYQRFAAQLDIKDYHCIPISALRGDNVVAISENMPWYSGSPLMAVLETIPIVKADARTTPFRFPVQWVNRPNLDFRGFCGTISSGQVSKGDKVYIQPSGKESQIARIVTYDGDLTTAEAGQSITITLTDEIDISRGDIISSVNSPAEVADQLEATIVWMDDQPLLPGRLYFLKVGCTLATVTVTQIKYQINVNTLERLAAKTLGLNAIGVCNINIDRQIPFDPYVANHDTGGFIIIDRFTNNTVGAGLIHFALRRAHNIHLQHLDLDKTARATLKGQRPCVLWFTGLSGAGKSTIANLVEKQLYAMGRHTYLLDGDNVRHGLNKDLGFTNEDRVENIRRIGEVAKLMVDAGLIVLVAFISPFKAERALVRSLFEDGEFLEVFIDTPLADAEARDPKGLYKKARAGKLTNFTGIDSPYEKPEQPDVRIDTTSISASGAAAQIIEMLNNRLQYSPKSL